MRANAYRLRFLPDESPPAVKLRAQRRGCPDAVTSAISALLAVSYYVLHTLAEVQIIQVNLVKNIEDDAFDCWVVQCVATTKNG